MPGEDYLLILGTKTLREKISIDVIKQLRNTTAASGGGAGSTEYAPAEVPAVPPEIIDVRCVAVTIEAMQQVADIKVEAAGETDEFKDALLDRVPKIMMGFGDSEMEKREQALEDVILRAAQEGMLPSDVAELRRLVLGHYKETFRRGRTGEPPAQVEPMRVLWTPTARTTKAKPILFAPEKCAWFSEQMKTLDRAHILYLDSQTIFASVAIALPKGDTYRMVADYRAVNNQVEKVPWPHPRLEEIQGFFEGTSC